MSENGALLHLRLRRADGAHHGEQRAIAPVEPDASTGEEPTPRDVYALRYKVDRLSVGRRPPVLLTDAAGDWKPHRQ